MPTDTARKAIEAMRTALAQVPRKDLRFHRVLADLRETCAAALDARTDLATLLVGHLGSNPPPGDPVAEAMNRVLSGLPSMEGVRPATPAEAATVWADFLLSSVEALLPHGLASARLLDPRAGGGDLVMAALRRGARTVFAHEGRLGAYYRAVGKLKTSPPNSLSFAHALTLPPRAPTPSFDFAFDENTERLRQAQESDVDAVVADLRGVKLPVWAKWAANRLRSADGRKRDGIVAFVSDEPFVDEPAHDGFRGFLESEFDLVAYVALEEGGMGFLARRGDLRAEHGTRILYAEGLAESYAAVDWRDLHPTADHVWRTEILRPEWAGFLPLAGDKALFSGTYEGVKGAGETVEKEDKRQRPVLKRPFVRVWRRAERGAVWPPEGPLLVVVREPFGAFVAEAAPDRRCAGPVAAFAPRDVSPLGLKRFRAAYGPGVVERDVFDYAVALLHHPLYRERYREDLRRGLPRLPLLQDFEALRDVKGAPPVGPGTAWGLGWTLPDLFEPGTVPDYDDPFASPYARADVDEGFLLFAGLGAALTQAYLRYERIAPSPLEMVGTDEELSFDRLRLSSDRTRVSVNSALRLEGVHPEATELRLGAKSPLEWLAQGLRGVDAETAARRVGAVVAASLEIRRLMGLLDGVVL